MKFKIFIIIAIGLLLQGCATAKGAKEGFKEDWKSMEAADEWMKENMW